MSTINFNLKNKDDNQIKNEILSKMSKIRQNYDNDNSYQELFYNVVANSNNKSNLKLSINKEGVYNLKVGAGNNNKTTTGILKGLGSLLGLSNTVEGTASVKSTEDVSGHDKSGEDVSGEDVSGEDVSGHDVSGTEEKKDESVMLDGYSFPLKVKDIKDNEFKEYIKKEINNDESKECPAGGLFGLGAKDCGEYKLEIEDYKRLKSSYDEEAQEEPEGHHVDEGHQGHEQVVQQGGMFGGDYDSDYSSDESIISSDDEAEDIIPYTTAVFDDDENDDMMDHIRNMKSKKYLKGLHTNELRDILRNNNLKITSGGNYLNKNEMIKSIKNYYK